MDTDRLDEANNTESTENLFNIRVIQRSLVYIIGIPQKYADEQTLIKHEFFGQFGTIKKMIINRRAYPLDFRHTEVTASAYITFSNPKEAKSCIQEIDESVLDNKVLKCTYGTTKYCSFYLKGITCQNSECMYLHSMCLPEDILRKDELTGTRHKLHDFECINRDMEVLGKRQKFQFLDELIQFKQHSEFRPPKKITFRPMDFENI